MRLGSSWVLASVNPSVETEPQFESVDLDGIVAIAAQERRPHEPACHVEPTLREDATAVHAHGNGKAVEVAEVDASPWSEEAASTDIPGEGQRQVDIHPVGIPEQRFDFESSVDAQAGSSVNQHWQAEPQASFRHCRQLHGNLAAQLEIAFDERDPAVELEVIQSRVRIAFEKGRATNPKLKVGICGEHGGDPSSVGFCHRVGLDYVSCSPFRVPIARLAAAQAAQKDPSLVARESVA